MYSNNLNNSSFNLHNNKNYNNFNNNWYNNLYFKNNNNYRINSKNNRTRIFKKIIIINHLIKLKSNM